MPVYFFMYRKLNVVCQHKKWYRKSVSKKHYREISGSDREQHENIGIGSGAKKWDRDISSYDRLGSTLELSQDRTKPLSRCISLKHKRLAVIWIGQHWSSCQLLSSGLKGLFTLASTQKGWFRDPNFELKELQANFHQIRLRSVTAVKRSPQRLESILVNVGYSTGYGRGMAQNRPQTGTSFTILASSISESCRFAAVSQK